MSEPILITAPTVEPVSLAEAKLHLRVTHSADDDLITALIESARVKAEHLTGRRLITQTWDWLLDDFPGSSESIKLHSGLYQPQSVGYIKYLDTDGVTQTWDAANYALDPYMIPGFIFPAADVNWPTDVADSANAVRVRVVCGFGDAASDVPAPIRAFIKMAVGTLYKFREDLVAGVSVAELPTTYAERLLDPYRVWAV